MVVYLSDRRIPDRLRQRIREDGGCWIWTGSVDSNGYPIIQATKKQLHMRSHLYLLTVDPGADPKSLRSSCAQILCVNPGHRHSRSGRLEPLEPLPESFWEKVYATGGCWFWNGAMSKDGYGIAYYKGKLSAHRAAYISLVGAIPDGLVIDHLCRNRACVNPDHLEPVTSAVNTRRGVTGQGSRANLLKTHCPRGHPLSGSNLYVDRKGGRSCKECRNAAAHRARRKAAARGSRTG